MDTKRKFDNIEELINFATGPTDMSDHDRGHGSFKHPENDWDNNTNLKQAFNLLESGWQEGADKVTDISAEVSDAGIGYVPLPGFEPSVEGEMVEPASYFAGEPECFYIQDPVETKIPVVKIGIPCSISAFATSKYLINRGLAMLSLINSIEKNRISTELWVISYVTYNNNTLLYEIKVKASDMPFDMDKLAFICAHPAFLRRIIFAVKEHETIKIREPIGIVRSGGYGTPGTYQSKDYDLLPDYNIEQFQTAEGSREWIKENASKVNITIND